MTWFLTEIPCHFMSQIDGSLVQIHIKLHDFSMTFIQVSFVYQAETSLIKESYGMSLECHDTWCHLLTSFLVEKDVKILWKCHDILMEFNRIFMRKTHPRKMPWECHEIPMSFNGITNFGSFWWYLYGKSPWNSHGIWRQFRPKLGWESMMAFYYEGMKEILLKFFQFF